MFEVVAAFAGVKSVPKPQLISTAEEAMILLAATGGKIDGIGRL